MADYESISPHKFMQVLQDGGMKTGKASNILQSIENPLRKGLVSVIRMDEILDADDIKAHLENLGISDESYEKLLKNYKPLPL